MIEFNGFDWDEGNEEHATRHGISKAQLEAAVALGMTVYAVSERNGEPRYLAVATTPEGLPIDFVFVVRNEKLRPISIHKLHRSKRKKK